MTETNPPASPLDTAPAKAQEPEDQQWLKIRDEEFEKYYKQREETCEAEDDAEKSYDTTLMTLASLAIGSTFTLLKDINTGGAAFLIFLSWIALGLCLFTALIDRLLSYTTHKTWREGFDNEFNKWSEGSWKRAVAAHQTIPFVNWLPTLKWVGFWSLLAGIVLLLLGGIVGWHSKAPQPNPAPITVNVYAATTQPVAKP